MDIVTGHVGSAHVTSWQDRDLNQGIFGPDTYILNVGSQMAASIITNNEIHIADGALVMQGCQGAIQLGTYDSISIDNGSSGMKRIDLICAEYTKVGGVESLGWTVIKGTPAASNPSEPSYTSGDIQNGDTPVQVPVYKAFLNGLTLEAVERQVPISDAITNVVADVWGLQNTVGHLYTDWQTNISMANNTYVTCASVSVLPGTYIVDAAIDFGSNTSGSMRDLVLWDVSGIPGYFKQSPSTGTRPNITRGCAVVVMASDGTIAVQGIQNSGSTISADMATISALRIK